MHYTPSKFLSIINLQDSILLVCIYMQSGKQCGSKKPAILSLYTLFNNRMYPSLTWKGLNDLSRKINIEKNAQISFICEKKFQIFIFDKFHIVIVT